MATCFCGHGEKVGIAHRGINKQGQRTVDQLANLRAIEAALGEMDSLGVLDDLIAEGEVYEAEWSALVHGRPPPPPSVAREYKKDWTHWGKRAMLLKAQLQQYEKSANGRKAFTRVYALAERLKDRLDSLPPGEARQAGEPLYSKLEPVTRGELPQTADRREAMSLMLTAELWLAATSEPPSALSGGASWQEPEPISEEPVPPPDPNAQAARRSEIEAIRESYESESGPTACPECGAEFEDHGSYLAHVTSEHA